MKKTKKQGLTSQQKKYLKSQILNLYLLLAIIDGAPIEKLTPSKAKPKVPKASKTKSKSEITVADKSETTEIDDGISDGAKPKAKRQFHLSRVFHNRVFYSAVGVFLFLCFIIVVQLLYPSNRALPLSRLDSAGYLGFADKDTILATFEDFDSRVVTVHTHTKSLTTSYKDLGVTIEPIKTVETITDYPLRDRLVPFSIFIKGNKSYQISRSLDESQLGLYVKDVIAQASKLPVDASVKRQGTQLIVSESEEGYEYQESVLRSQILRSELNDRGQIVFAPTILKPDITTDTAKFVSSRMQQRIDSPMLINAESHSIKIEPATMASWVDIADAPSQNTINITFNKKKVFKTLQSLVYEVDKDPIPTVVTYLNGVQAGRLDGKVGKKLEFNDLVQRVASNTSPVTSTIEASVKTLSPPENIDRRYTRDSNGLQNLLEYWTSTHSGQYSIDVRSVNGAIKANVNPHRLVPSVGIYRIYIASLIYGRVSGGSIALSSNTQAGRTVDTCLELMLRDSDESCTNALGQIVGWGVSDSLLKSQGFESTTLTMGASLSTANDVSDWMIKLLEGSITERWQADAITDDMSRQIYRSGIPSGSLGSEVANKSGSYGRINNDIGIIYHPSGTYVLTILSEGSDFSSIADLSNEIYKVMSQ